MSRRGKLTDEERITALREDQDGKDGYKAIGKIWSNGLCYGIPCIWWDNNAFNGNGEYFGLLNRGTCQIQFPEIMAALLHGAASRG